MSEGLGEDLPERAQAWVEDNWDTTINVGEWWLRLADEGYAYPTWPVGLGGLEASRRDASLIAGVLAENRVIGPPAGVMAAGLAAPTLLQHATEAQQRVVRPIATGEAAWCQLFSEPGSGSDLASIGTRAERDGDEWVVTGQKVWNSAADSADFGMLLARTDVEVPKHAGITYFAIDMRQPGIEVRPLKQMNGATNFCEVFLTEARVPDTRVIGDVNDGWRVAQTTLRNERNAVAGGGPSGLVMARSGSQGDVGRKVNEVLERAHEAARSRKSPLSSGAVPSKLMVQLAQSFGVSSDPVVRQELARYITQVRVNGWTMRRSAVAGGRLTGADGSIAKLSTARICQQSRDVSYRIVGAAGMLMGRGYRLLEGDLQMVNLASPGLGSEGGLTKSSSTCWVKRGLGLPREPSCDTDVPYRDLQVGTQVRSASA